MAAKTKTGKKSVKLNIDSDILDKNLRLFKDDPDLSDNFLNSCLNTENLVGPGWKIVTPTPGLCLKTTDEKKGKVFINLCKLEDVPKPPDFENLQPTAEKCIPLSLQEPRQELDKSGHPTVAYDVAINPELFSKVETDDIIRQFIFQVVLQSIEDKYNVELNKLDVIVMKNRKCLGELTPHRIRTQKGEYKPPKRLIEEVSSTETADRHYTVPDFKLSSRDFEYLSAQISLPKVRNTRDIIVDIGEDRIVVECPRAGYLLDIFLPCFIDQDDVEAVFDRSKMLNMRLKLLDPPS